MLLEGGHTTPCKILSGVPKGTIMVPVLFLIYINGIPNSITNMLRLYADDTLLYSIINSAADCITYRLTYQLYKNGVRHGRWSLIQPSVNTFKSPTNNYFVDTHYTLYGYTIKSY